VGVQLADGTNLSGRVLGADTDVDIAVVKVDRTGLPAAVLGSALSLHPGDSVVAVGNPLGLQGSVSSGVISALGRYVPEENGGLRAAIQTDAAINPGNSGGALLDLSGKVVGITAAKAGGQSIDSIGFAIPIDVAKAIADDLSAGKNPSHPYLGISGPEVDATTAQALGSPVGSRIDDVGTNTPAAKAGLKAGDIITSIDSTQIGSFFDQSVPPATPATRCNSASPTAAPSPSPSPNARPDRPGGGAPTREAPGGRRRPASRRAGHGVA
jgi:S1-C subfamily serine protease